MSESTYSEFSKSSELTFKLNSDKNKTEILKNNDEDSALFDDDTEEGNIQKVLSYKRMTLTVPSSRFVRRSSRAFKGKKEEYKSFCEPVIEEEIEVNFQKLQVNTLRKYKKVYKLPSPANITKLKLANMVSQHFKNLPLLSEKEIVTYFIHFVKTRNDDFINKDLTRKIM